MLGNIHKNYEQVNHQSVHLSAKPECTTDPECPDHLACVDQKCKNPCFTSTCGVNAQCRVQKHRAICVCNRGFVGDPYRICEERKLFFSVFDPILPDSPSTLLFFI